MNRLVQIRETTAARVTRPFVRLLARTGVSPNVITWFGFFIAIGAALLIASGFPIAGGAMVLFGGLFDMLDGALARLTKRVTRFGGILDSTIDRLSEVVILLGILVFYAREPSIPGILLAGMALPGSLLVSYLRARAEAASLECKVGLFTRTERVIVLALGLLLSQLNFALFIALGIIVFFSFFTVIQRLAHIWRQSRV